MWIPNINKLEGPRYLAVAAAIAKAIDGGQLTPGAQLPPQRDLAVKLGVTVGTISRAYAIAKKRKLVSGEVGRGTFVSGARNHAAASSVIPQEDSRAIDLACYRLPTEGLSDAVSRALIDLGERPTMLALHRYPPAAGFMTHRAAGGAWIARTGFEVAAESILVCNGAQQALSLALTTLVNPGEKLLTEAVTYSGAKALATLGAFELVGVEMDAQGMIPEALDEAAARSNARVLYVQPTVHNPTTALMPASRRQKIADIARRRELTLVEDDAACSALADRPLPISALVPERSCYITSVSKSLSPAFRVGYLSAPPHLLDLLQGVFHAHVLGASPVLAELVSQMIASGVAEELARRNLQESARLYQAAMSLLAPFEKHAHPAAFFLWLSLPRQWTSDEFAMAARADGVSVVPSGNFLAARDRPVHAVRVSLGLSPGSEALQSGLGVLTRLLRATPRLREAII